MPPHSKSHSALLLYLFKIGFLAFFIFSTFLTFNYYQSKKVRWFDYIPENTAFAVKINTNILAQDSIADAKLRSLIIPLFKNHNQDLKQLLSQIHTPVTVLAIATQDTLEPALVVTNQDPLLKDLGSYNQYPVTPDLTLVTHLKEPNLKPLSISIPTSQLNNHPANSFAYLYIDPDQLASSYFWDRLLTANQKSIQSLLSKSQPVFFNVETKDHKLYFSNYTNSSSLSQFQAALKVEDLKDLPEFNNFAFVTEAVEQVLPKTLVTIIKKIANNADIHPNSLEMILKSKLSISQDQFGQWYMDFSSESELTQSQISSLVQLLHAYFTPHKTSHQLQTNQQSSYSLASLNTEAQTLENQVYGTLYLQSINQYLHYKTKSNTRWQLVFSPFADLQKKTGNQFQIQNPDALSKSQEFMTFNLQTLVGLLNLDWQSPSYQAEVFSRDYRFGTHTLIVIE